VHGPLGEQGEDRRPDVAAPGAAAPAVPARWAEARACRAEWAPEGPEGRLPAAEARLSLEIRWTPHGNHLSFLVVFRPSNESTIG
jgi:hypothetical protein